MNFESKTIKTKDWSNSWYGKISVILFCISIIVIYFLKPGFFNRDFLSEWFGQYAKPFLMLNFLFKFNGFVVILTPSFKYKTIGRIEISDEGINVVESSFKKGFKITDINSIRFKYNGHKKGWYSLMNVGNLNLIDILDKHRDTYSFEILINSKKHKQDFIYSLLVLKEKGIEIKIDYFTNYFTDIDFKEIKK